MKRSIKLAATLPTALAMAFGSAQQPPPADPQDSAPQDQQEEKAPPPLRNWEFTYDLGYTRWDLNGNFQKFRQYATPPEGFHVRRLTYEHWMGNMANGFRAYAMSPGEDDYRAGANFVLGYGTTRVGGSTDRARFFDSTPVIIQESQRQSSEGYLRQNIGRDFAVTLRSHLDQQDHNFDPPKASLHQRTQNWSASATGSVGSGFVDLTFGGTQFYDRTNVLPDSETRRWGLSFGRAIAPRLNVEGGFTRSTIELAGRSNEVDSWSISGDWQATDNTDFVFDFRRDSLDLPTIQNAFVRERSMARARVIHRWPGWSAQLGYRRSDIERVRANHLFVDTPQWHGMEARISGRVSPSTRVTARIGRDSMSGAAQMFTVDPRASYWDDRAFAQFKVDVATERFLGYGVYTFRENKNDVRDTQVRNHGLTLGGTLQASPNLDVFVEATTDLWSGRTGDVLNPNLDDFLGDGSVLTLGANWTLSASSYASLSFTQYVVANKNPLLDRDTNVHGNFLTAGLHHRFPSGCEVGLTLAPWRYSDRAFRSMGYDTFLLGLIASGKF